MPHLLLDRRQNYRNYLRTECPAETVTYLLRDGEQRSVAWLGFIERAAARQLAGARPVRLCHVAQIDEGDRRSPRWREVPPGHYVLGCLTERGAYAVCDTVVAMVEPKGG